MRFDDVVGLLGAEPSFDLATVTQLIAEPRASVVSQLHRWGRAGKVVALDVGRLIQDVRPFLERAADARLLERANLAAALAAG